MLCGCSQMENAVITTFVLRCALGYEESTSTVISTE